MGVSRQLLARRDPAYTTRVAVVGLGPWGLAVLERLVEVARRQEASLVVDVVEPGEPGVGIFSLDDPDYLPLNTPCGQHVMHPTGGEPDRPPYAQSLYAWARWQGYKWVGRECRIADEGREITPHDFLPRKLMGAWLRWSYHTLVATRPQHVSIVHHATTAVDIEPAIDRRELVHLADGRALLVDHVILTMGHTPDESELDGSRARLSPYPVHRLNGLIAPGDAVAVSGLGLVALDVVSALTTGRGGCFEERGGRLRYRRSGREPVIYLFSRSGQPYSAKAMGASDPTGEYAPVICTPGAVARLRAQDDGLPVRGMVDFRRDCLPLIYAEMQVRFYRQSAAIVEPDPHAAEEVTEALRTAWSDGRFAAAIASYAARYGDFDPERHLLGDVDDRLYLSAKDYENSFYEVAEADISEAMMENTVSPLKAASETLRVLRDTIRSVIDFQGLTLESYLDFQASLSNRMKSAVAGPPVGRMRELLALMDANVVQLPFGPSPTVDSNRESGHVIRSTRLARPYVQRVDHLVGGHLPDPSIARTRSPLLRRLASRGRIRPCRYGELEVGSIDLTLQSHPVGRDEVQERIWVFGSLTEGIRYFTYYVPSPKSRVRAFVDAEACAEEIFASPAKTGRSRSAGRPFFIDQQQPGVVVEDPVVVDHNGSPVGVAEESSQAVWGILPVAGQAADDERLVNDADHQGGGGHLERVH